MNESLKKYNELLLERNKVLNLTAHKTLEVSWKYNIEDSLLFAKVIENHVRANQGSSLVDLGSGCGSPAIPLKIAIPGLDVTLIDSVGKKVAFLNETVEALGLPGIRAKYMRIEELAATSREKFNFATARAVASLPTLLEYALPLLRVGGFLFAYKARGVCGEIDASKNALAILGGQVISVAEANLDEETVRTLVIVKKVSQTPSKYPRGQNLPRLRPL